VQRYIAMSWIRFIRRHSLFEVESGKAAGKDKGAETTFILRWLGGSHLKDAVALSFG